MTDLPNSGFYRTFDGVTNSVLPIDDQVDTPYLSFMEVPIEASYIDTLYHQQSVLHELIEQEETKTYQPLISNQSWLWDLIHQSLTPRQFQIFQLRYMYGYTQDKISAIVQLSGGQAVISQVLRNCRVRLKKKLGHVLESLLATS